jgi:ABC-type amino acid transport system permease subunit
LVGELMCVMWPSKTSCSFIKEFLNVFVLAVNVDCWNIKRNKYIFKLITWVLDQQSIINFIYKTETNIIRPTPFMMCLIFTYRMVLKTFHHDVNLFIHVTISLAHQVLRPQICHCTVERRNQNRKYDWNF